MLFAETMKAFITVSEDGQLSVFMGTDKSEDPIYSADLMTMIKEDKVYDPDNARIPEDVIMNVINGSMSDFSNHFLSSLKAAVTIVEEKNREAIRANGKKV